MECLTPIRTDPTATTKFRPVQNGEIVVGTRFPKVMRIESRMDIYLLMVLNSRSYDDLYLGSVNMTAKRLGHSEKTEKRRMTKLMDFGFVRKLNSQGAYVVEHPQSGNNARFREREIELYEYLSLNSGSYKNVFVGKVADIRQATGYSIHTVKKSLADLLDLGVIERLAVSVYKVNDLRGFLEV